LLSMGGTSMSCPTAAGNAAVLRQYFMDGYHVTGKRDPSNGFAPSAALLKAIFISSGQEMQGLLDFFGEYVEIHPTEQSSIYLNSLFIEGFGLISLPKVMNLGA